MDVLADDHATRWESLLVALERYRALDEGEQQHCTITVRT
jgi:hypothetical protein